MKKFAKDFEQSRAFTAENALECLGQIENLLLDRYTSYGKNVLQKVNEAGGAEGEDIVVQALKNLTTMKPRFENKTKIDGNTINGNKNNVKNVTSPKSKEDDIQFEDSPFKNFQQAMTTAVNVLSNQSDEGESPQVFINNTHLQKNSSRSPGLFGRKKSSLSSRENDEITAHHALN